MSSIATSNVATVSAMYAAFGRGDIPAILEHLSDSVEWEYGVPSTDVPWLQPRHGRAAAGGFFEALRALEFHRFEVTAVVESGDLVIALCNVEATVIATGKRFVEEDEVHLWRFDEEGKVARFRHRADTHLQWRALQ